MSEWIYTDFGKMPSNWGTDVLGNICHFITDGSHSSPRPVPSEYLMASVKDMRYNCFDFSSCKTISKEDFEMLNSNNCSPKIGDLLLSKDGANCLDIIFIYKQPQKIVLLSSIAIARLKDGFHPDFYRYFLLAPKTQELMRNNFISGSAIPRVILKDFKNVPVPILDFIHQSKIVETLSSLDDKIDLLHRQNRTLEELAVTLFRQWFVEEVEDGWAETSLQAQTEVFRGLSYKGSGLAEEGNGIPMHNLNSVYEGGGYKLDGIKFYNGEYRDRHVIKPGEIIVTNTEQGHEHKLIGFPAIVPDYYGDLGLFSQHIYKLKTLPESYLSNEFLYYLLMTHSMREQIIGATNGSTVNMLAIDGLQRPEFRLPPIEKVIEYTEIVKNYWKKKNSNNNQIRTLTGLRDTLLPKLMSGELKLNGTP
jgi:type I restriction enzyme S subunit